MVLTTLFLVFFGYLLPFSRRMKIATLWNLWNSVSVYQIITGNRVIVEGLDNIPDAPFVAVSNHHSEWETLYLGRVLQPLSIVIKKELTKIPVFGWAMIAARHIAIDRTNPRASIQQIVDQGKQRIEAGISVLIFPEATRVPVGQFKRFGAQRPKLR